MKNKGIIIELTALLDVIFIMLFWVMINMQEKTEEINNNAETRIAETEQKMQDSEIQYRQEIESLHQKLDETREDFEAERLSLEDKLEKALKAAENPEETARANQYALNEYAQGNIITLNLKYDSVGKLFILDRDGEIGKTLVNSPENISESIIYSLENSGFYEDDVILCALVYDGSRALYRDIQNISAAVEEAAEVYNNFYCTYINIS